MPSYELYYDGSIAVDSDEYIETCYDEEAEDVVEAEIEGLDDIVVERSHVKLTLDYPFERPYTTEIIGDRGITLRQIIDAVRTGFRRMYAGAAHAPIPNLPGNERVKGEFGEAFHAIHDLVIEGIIFHEEERRLEILIGS